MKPPSYDNDAKTSGAPLTPRVAAGKRLIKSAQSDLREAQRRLDRARELRRSAAA